MVAEISLTPDNGNVGDTIQIDGTGFTATEDITLTYGGQPLTPVAPISTDGAGAFTGDFIVPASVQGIHSVVATDETLLTDDANFTVNSLIVIDQVSAQVGDTIDVVGTGFDTESVMSFTFDAEAIVPVGGAISTDVDGGFTTTFVVIAAPNGARDLVATDAGTNTDTDSITVDALVTLSVASGRIGASVTVTGSGFSATSAITIEMGVTDITGAALNSDANGGFSRVITVPTKVSGANPIDATDAAAVTDQAAFSVLAPTLVLTENNGPVGTVVTCTGDNYVPNGTITMTNLDGDDSVTFTANATGSIPASSTLVIPEAVEGAADINADDGTNDIDAEFTVETSLEINPEEGETGSQITLIGHGYASTEGITVTVNGVQVVPTPDPTTTDAAGYFTNTITIPSTPLGSIDIIATDETGNDATAVIDIVSGLEDPSFNGPMAYRKLASGLYTNPSELINSASMAAVLTIDSRNYDKILVQVQNIDERVDHNLDYNVFGSLDPNGDNPPAFSTATWIQIFTSDIEVAKNATKSSVITDPYLWLCVAAKKTSGDSESIANVFIRGINTGHNS